TVVRLTVALNVLDEDAKKTWVDDAESAISHGSIETARAIYAHALKVAEMFWLMGAKERWLAGDVPGAQAILTEAFKVNPESEQIWLAAVKLEWETGQHERARTLLQHARERASDAQRVWMKSVVLERQLGHYDEALKLLDEALVKYPNFHKLHIIRGQIHHEHHGDVASAREAYSKGLKACPKSIPLWLLSSRLEELTGMLVKARAILERGRLLNPKVPEMWVEAIRNKKKRKKGMLTARAVFTHTALQECPNSGLVWSEAILLEQRNQRRSKSVDALKKCDNDPHVFITVARLFWQERKYEKARGWFQKAVKLNPDLGDAW
ncbi:MAG: hypothetical protein BJ554DRAFT_4234, partial [Olpidium bornovanus]